MTITVAVWVGLMYGMQTMSLHPALAVLLADGQSFASGAPGAAIPDGVTTSLIDIPMPGGHARLAVHRPDTPLSDETILWFPDNLPSILQHHSSRDAMRLSAHTGRRVLETGIGNPPRACDPFPLRDMEALSRWLSENPDATEMGERVYMAGQGTGGGLAACACASCREIFAPEPAGAILVCPLLDFAMTSPSCETMWNGYGLDGDQVLAWIETVIPDEDRRRQPDLSPFWQSSYAHMPATFIATAEYDMFRDEADAYAALLEDDSVDVRSKCYAGMIHDFMSLDAVVAEAEELLDDIRAFLDCKTGSGIRQDN